MTANSPKVIRDGDLLVEKDVPISLMDGHVLYCNVFRPNRDGVFPPIVVFTPYGKDSDVAVDFKRYWDFVLRDHPEVVQGDSDGRYLTWEVPDPQRWVPAGYAIVVIDARGTGKSPGFYEMMSPLQTRDYYDAIEWAGVQSWSNGKVGLLGVSYLAIKQWQVAALQPPHLAAMIPWEGMFDHYRDLYRHGGIYSSFFLKLLWDTQLAINQNGNAGSPYRDRFTGEVATGAVLNRSSWPAISPMSMKPDCTIRWMTPISSFARLSRNASKCHSYRPEIGAGSDCICAAISRDSRRRPRGKNGWKCTPTRISPRCTLRRP